MPDDSAHPERDPNLRIPIVRPKHRHRKSVRRKQSAGSRVSRTTRSTIRWSSRRPSRRGGGRGHGGATSHAPITLQQRRNEYRMRDPGSNPSRTTFAKGHFHGGRRPGRRDHHTVQQLDWDNTFGHGRRAPGSGSEVPPFALVSPLIRYCGTSHALEARRADRAVLIDFRRLPAVIQTLGALPVDHVHGGEQAVQAGEPGERAVLEFPVAEVAGGDADKA